ncbi:MAG: FAD-binding protein, partial [Bacteroidota bacterium]
MSHRKTPTQLLKEESISLLKKRSSRTLIPSNSKISRNKLRKLELKIQGRLIYPWSPDYNKYKNDFSNTYPTDPQIIALVENHDDIRELLSFANSRNLWTVIRSGGHSLADYSVCDGMVIDLRNLNSVYVDYYNKTVTVDSGVLFGNLNGH